MAGDADPRDPVLVEQSGVEELHGVGELAEGTIEAAADEQRLIDARLTHEPREVLLDERTARNASRRQMRDGVESFAAQPGRDRDGVGEGGAGEEGDGDGGAGPQMDAVIRDLPGRAGGGLGGELRQQIDDPPPDGRPGPGVRDGVRLVVDDGPVGGPAIAAAHVPHQPPASSRTAGGY